MTKEEFIEALDRQRIHYTEEDGRLIVGRVTVPVDGYISFYYLGIDSMPPNVTFENKGHLQLGTTKEIPQGVFFNNEGYVYWHDTRGKLDKIPRGTRFGKLVKGIVLKGGFLDFGIPEINEGDLLTATFKYL